MSHVSHDLLYNSHGGRPYLNCVRLNLSAPLSLPQLDLGLLVARQEASLHSNIVVILHSPLILLLFKGRQVYLLSETNAQ